MSEEQYLSASLKFGGCSSIEKMGIGRLRGLRREDARLGEDKNLPGHPLPFRLERSSPGAHLPQTPLSSSQLLFSCDWMGTGYTIINQCGDDLNGGRGERYKQHHNHLTINQLSGSGDRSRSYNGRNKSTRHR
eukprot:scaffold25986_cov77-Cyclotella_meneghiniana.AAC.3